MLFKHSMSVYETFSGLYFLTFGCDTKSQPGKKKCISNFGFLSRGSRKTRLEKKSMSPNRSLFSKQINHFFDFHLSMGTSFDRACKAESTSKFQ